jgi:hypothetical protein
LRLVARFHGLGWAVEESFGANYRRWGWWECMLLVDVVEWAAVVIRRGIMEEKERDVC